MQVTVPAARTVRNRGTKPSSLRYYQDGPPAQVDLSTWRLTVSGIGVRELVFDYDDLVSGFPQVEQQRRMVCVCNWSIRGIWCGALLEDVLRAAGLEDGEGLFLKQTSIGTPEKGKYESTIPLAPALDRQALLCHSLDGAPLPLDRGFPLRLWDFGQYGYKSVKGLERLEVTDVFELGEWELRAGYEKDGTIRPKRYWIVDLVEHRFVEAPGEVTEF
jgi:DMSO/TMAO reductase YedYZ molybdopterin-dependent catalytic subunit